MATSSLSKAPCATCGNKAAGIFRCEGCVQVFCRKHLNEHRDILSHQLDELVLEHDTLQQTIVESNNKFNKQHPALKEIDQWEKESIAKIQRLAEEVRNELKKMIRSQTVPKELRDLAERLQKARTDDDYVELDLRTWQAKLQKLKEDFNKQISLITVQEDRTRVVIGCMRVSSAALPILSQTEKFGKIIGTVRIDDDGCLATHAGLANEPVYVYGVNEYSTGTHKIRFLFQKQHANYISQFNIVSKRSLIYKQKSVESGYGWSSTDTTWISDQNLNPDKNFRDMRGETTFEIELQLDCDSQTISYVNQRTKNKREMNVDIVKCPFPWQIRFYMYEVGDCVRLLT